MSIGEIARQKRLPSIRDDKCHPAKGDKFAARAGHTRGNTHFLCDIFVLLPPWQ